jgi:hypothetical protein
MEFLMDWGLVKIASTRQLFHDLPDGPDAVQMGPMSEIVNYRMLDFDQEYKVAKFGGTSGWTTGAINRAAFYLRLRDDDSSLLPVGPAHRFGKVGLACGILDDKKETDFIEPGDSGSIVLLNEVTIEACAVGLGFASNQSNYVSYMVPCDLVVKNTEKVTKCKVTTPQLYKAKLEHGA